VGGANLARVTFWNPDLLSPDGLAMLERYITATGTVLITIDPLRAHLGKAVDDRAALAPLTRLCHRTGVALVAVDHTRRNPRASGSLTDAMLGTGSGFMANARALFVFGKNADDPDQRLLVGAGANHSDDEGRGMIFEFDLAPTEINGEETEVARLLLVDPDAVIPGDKVLRDSNALTETKGSPIKRAIASEWLTTLLMFGEVHADKIKARAAEDGLSWSTVRRASDQLGVVKRAAARGFGKARDSWGALPAEHPVLKLAAQSKGAGKFDPTQMPGQMTVEDVLNAIDAAGTVDDPTDEEATDDAA